MSKESENQKDWMSEEFEPANQKDWNGMWDKISNETVDKILNLTKKINFTDTQDKHTLFSLTSPHKIYLYLQIKSSDYQDKYTGNELTEDKLFLEMLECGDHLCDEISLILKGKQKTFRSKDN